MELGRPPAVPLLDTKLKYPSSPGYRVAGMEAKHVFAVDRFVANRGELIFGALPTLPTPANRS